MNGSVEASMIRSLADHISDAAGLLTTVERRLSEHAVPASFGPEEAGGPGDLGHRLRAHWTAVVAARAEEAAEVAAALTGMASSVRVTANDYAETDKALAHRLEAL